MVPTLVLALTLTPGVDVFGGARSEPLGPKAYPPVYVPAESPAGYLYDRPSISTPCRVPPRSAMPRSRATSFS